MFAWFMAGTAVASWVHMASHSFAATRAVTLASGGHLVGKILSKRYVLLEELEADEAPAGTCFLAYDMNSLCRINVLVLRDNEGELDPERYELEPDGKTGAPALVDALDRAFAMDAEPPLPADSTQPLRLAEMEELEQEQEQEQETPDTSLLRVEPSRPVPGGKDRPETRRIEAAWFAMGHEMGEEQDAPEPPTEAPGDLDAAQLWQQASSLSRDEYQRFALDLSPPAPPPAPAPQEGNPDKAVAGEIVAPATPPEPPGAPDHKEPALAERRDRAEPEASPRLQIIEPSTRPAPAPRGDSTRYIKQEMGVISPVERVKQNRIFRWSIDTRAGTFVLGAVAGTLLTLLVSC